MEEKLNKMVDKKMDVKRPPVIFISSVVKGLKRIRDNLRQKIEDELGFEVWCSEISAESTRSSSLKVCLDNVAKCDVYIGILSRRYGYVVYPWGKAFTELEYLEALRLGKEIKIYIQKDWGIKAEKSLKRFIKLVTDTHIGHFVRFYSTYSDLERMVLHDLQKWYEKPGNPPSSLFMELMLRDPVEIVSEMTFLPINLLKLEGMSRKFDREHVLNKISQMQSCIDEKNYLGTISTGWEALGILLSKPPKLTDTESLKLWTEFFVKWGKAASWLGYDGLLGAYAVGKCVLQLSLIMEDHRNICLSSSTLASRCFSLSNFETARGRILMDRELRVRALQLLDEAHFWIDFALANSKILSEFPRGILSIYGNILVKLGDFKKESYDKAEKVLAECLLNAESQLAYLETKMSLGSVEVRSNGKRKKGERDLLEAREGFEHLPGGFLARAIRRWASYLITIGEKNEAKNEIRKAFELCQKYGLSGQRMKILPLALQLELTDKQLVSQSYS